MPHFKKYVEIDKINFKNLSKKNQKTECDIMDLNKKILIISMLVMLVCCVSAVSATDINGTDDISDDIIIDENPVDEITDVVEDAKIDEVEDDPVEEQQNPVEDGTVNGYTYDYYFNTITGELVPSENLNFTGNFYAKDFGNFKVGKTITINAEGATFHNIGFDLTVSDIIINGGTFIFDNPGNITSVISSNHSGTVINNTIINVTAPENQNCYAINIYSAGNSQILNNVIYYVDDYANNRSYNYVVKVNSSSEVKMVGNNITAILPMKTVEWFDKNFTGINRNFVAGIAVTGSNYFNLTGNKLDITGNSRDGTGPTLDAVLIYESNHVTIEKNTIMEKDINSTTGQYSYIYGVDAIKCSQMTINNNTIIMNADQSGGYIGGNGTGAAYCVQLTGSYTGTTVSNNILTTQNNGPNAAIYSQNWDGQTDVTIAGNTITVTGKGTSATWDLLTGIELQDDNAVVTGNTITVNNNGDYDTGYNVYGISYCQYSPRYHTYSITNNTVSVNGGNYTVYIMNGHGCNVTGNTLNSNYLDEDEDERVYHSGNSTVIIAAGEDNTIGPNP